MAKTVDELTQIKLQLDAQYKPVYTVILNASDDNDEDTRTIYLKKYDRAILSAVQKLAGGPDPLKSIEAFIKNTYIGGDDLNEILSDLDMLRSLEEIVVDLITAKKAKLIKN